MKSLEAPNEENTRHLRSAGTIYSGALCDAVSSGHRVNLTLRSLKLQCNLPSSHVVLNVVVSSLEHLIVILFTKKDV